MMKTDFKKLPWYRQAWPWFLLLLPLTAVVASLFTVFLFNQHQVALVSEEYYKEGKGINQELGALRQAIALGINATLTQNRDTVIIKLDKGKQTNYSAVKIHFQHRTLPEKDIQQLLTPDFDGSYHLFLDEPLVGPWYITLSHYDDSWRIHAKANFPRPSVKLTGK